MGAFNSAFTNHDLCFGGKPIKPVIPHIHHHRKNHSDHHITVITMKVVHFKTLKNLIPSLFYCDSCVTVVCDGCV